jgi:hypothetical protein
MVVTQCILSPCGSAGHPFESVVVLGTLSDLHGLPTRFRFIVFKEIPVYIAQVD